MMVMMNPKQKQMSSTLYIVYLFCCKENFIFIIAHRDNIMAVLNIFRNILKYKGKIHLCFLQPFHIASWQLSKEGTNGFYHMLTFFALR